MDKNQKDFKNGWLNRRGVFYPCKFNHHAREEIKLQKLLKLPNSLEYLGWFKVHGVGVCFYEAWTWMGRQHVKPTKSQLSWLFKRGYPVDRFK